MSLGKDSIKRAAKAESEGSTEVKAEAAESTAEAKAEPETKAEPLEPAAEKAPAKKTRTRKTGTAGKAGAAKAEKSAPAKKPVRRRKAKVSEPVPEAAETPEEETASKNTDNFGIIGINEELPVYLL